MQHARQYLMLTELLVRQESLSSTSVDVQISHVKTISQLLFMMMLSSPEAAAAAAAGKGVSAGNATRHIPADAMRVDNLLPLVVSCLKLLGAALRDADFTTSVTQQRYCNRRRNWDFYDDIPDGFPFEVLLFTIWPFTLASAGLMPLLDDDAANSSMWAAMKAAVSSSASRQQTDNCAVGGASGTSSNEGTSRPRPLSSHTAAAAEEPSAVAAGGMGRNLWCVLVARCLVEAGRSFQQQHPIVSSIQGSKLAGVELITLALASCREIVIWLKQQLPAAMTAAAADPPAAAAVVGGPPAMEEEEEVLGGSVQHLLDVAGQLLMKLECCRVEMNETRFSLGQCISDEMCFLAGLQGFLLFDPVDIEAAAVLAKDAAALAALGQQLEMFGAAVCAQLPVQQCCNYHLCCNVAKHSELELVSGKSCVCGSCKTARYCSTACQKAHWHGWHKPVCKRLKQQVKMQK
jgi:hypothetical protein